MSASLYSDVTQDLLPQLVPLGAEVVGHSGEGPFGDALVVISIGGLGFRVIRDRGQLFVEVGAIGSGEEWFDASLVDALLSPDPKTVAGATPSRPVGMSAIAKYVISRLAQFRDLFSRERYPRTRKQLEDLKRTRVAARFGLKQ